MKMPTQAQWAKVLTRWSETIDSGERRLMIALLSGAISEEIKASKDRAIFADSYFQRPENGFDFHLSLIGVDPTFVREEMTRFAHAS